MKFKYIAKENINSLPIETGVYSFVGKNRQEIFYIGKASNIKIRVKNHFQQPSFRDNLYKEKVEKIGFIITESEVEALILESQLIKNYKPKYNVLWKDDKNYFYVAITEEAFPRVLIVHQKLQVKSFNIGPFVDGRALKKTLSILRQIFPYYTASNIKHSQKPCQWCHLKLCPGPNPDKRQYKKDIKNLSLFLQGKKQSLLRKLKSEMAKQAKVKNFEAAARTRDQLISLEKTLSNSRVFATSPFKEENHEQNWLQTEKYLQKILEIKNQISKIETYDISNIQGKMATGSMVVFVNGKAEKNLYRKFRIKMKNEPNDTAMLKEVLTRRFNHQEWLLPQIMLIDGGKGQLNAVLEIKQQTPEAKNIKILSLAKKNNELFIEGTKQPLLLKDMPQDVSNLILHSRDEAHRFAITYHRKLRVKSLSATK